MSKKNKNLLGSFEIMGFTFNVYKSKSKYYLANVTAQNDFIALKGMKVIDHKNGFFLAYPSYEYDDDYNNYYFFYEKEMLKDIYDELKEIFEENDIEFTERKKDKKKKDKKKKSKKKKDDKNPFEDDEDDEE